MGHRLTATDPGAPRPPTEQVGGRTVSQVFFVPGVPAPQGSKNAYVRGGRAVLVESSKKVPAWRAAVALVARQHYRTPVDGPVAVAIEFVMPRTKAMRNRPAPPMATAPDIDKLARSTLDGLTAGGAITDDRIVTHLTLHKRRAAPEEPTGAHITITT